MRFEKQRAGGGQQAAGRRSQRELPTAYGLQPTASPPRGAMTLVELLVVIVLVSTLVATAIPVISPGGDGRKLRESSRNLNSYLQGAQARAMQTGRPFGVALRRLSAETDRGTDNAVCVRVEYVEVPPTYSGFTRTSSARLAINPAYNVDGVETLASPMLLQFVARGVATTQGLPAGWQADLVPPRFLRPGDTIEISGRRYVLLEPVDAAGAIVSTNGYFEPQTGQLVRFAVRPLGSRSPTPESSLPMLDVAYRPNGARISGPEAIFAEVATDGLEPTNADSLYWTEPQPYKVFRQPIPAAGEPLELPSGMAIDLQASVIGGISLTRLYEPSADYDTPNSDFVAIDEPIQLLFAPEGHLQRVHGLLGGAIDTSSRALLPSRTVTSYVALCIGRRELIPGAPFGAAATPLTAASYENPININQSSSEPSEAVDTSIPFEDDTAFREITDRYNWLNLESRWVVIGGQSGSVVTVENVTPDVTDSSQLTNTAGQLRGALENARSRTKIGGR